MIERRHLLSALAGLAAVGVARAQGVAAAAVPASAPASGAAAAPRVGELQALGNERYRIGNVAIDKRARSFSVPGRMQALDKPLEYLATTPTGRKAYESLLALDASGTEINLACILIGLERDAKVPSWQPLAKAGVAGQPVRLTLAWTDAAGQRRRLGAAEALLPADATAQAAAVEWVYTGSFTSTDGSRLAADFTGTLVSFVKKDLSGVIEVVSDLGLGPYGSVRGNTVLPPEGTAVELIVEAGKASK